MHEEDGALGRIEQKIDGLVERLFNGGTGLINIIQEDHKVIESKVTDLETAHHMQKGFLKAVTLIGGILWAVTVFILTYHLAQGGK